MKTIKISVRDKIAVNMSGVSYTCGNSDFVINFDFDAEWDEFSVKTARFIKDDRTYQDQVFQGNKCPIPVLYNTNKIRVGVFAGNLHTSTPAIVKANKGILCVGGSPEAPSEDVYAQIMEMLNATGGGSSCMSAEAKDLLLTILRNGEYSTDQSGNIDALEEALSGSGGGETPGEPDKPVATYTVTSVLLNVTSTNPTTALTEGARYIATLTADDGYALDSVSVVMGGVDVTADVYADGVITINSVAGDVVITAYAKAMPSYFNVNWSNYAITCGQNTDNYNAWAPHNLQYDDVNDAFIFLQCHTNKHLNHTVSKWTLSRIYPDEPWRVDDLGLPAENALGELWIENGVWYVLQKNGTTAYKSSDMGATWEQFTINLSIPLWGIYKCNGVYYSGDDTNTDTYYTSKDLVTWEVHNFGFSEQYPALMEAAFHWYKNAVWVFIRTNDATLGHPVILKSSDGLTWEFVSDSLLHSYRSMIGCYAYEDYIIVADIDRDNGILYYSRFDGTTVEDLNEWNVGDKKDDFHCPCICSDGAGTVVITYMLHSWVETGSYSDTMQYYCENMMLVGKTSVAKLHNLSIEDLEYTNAETFVANYCDIYPVDAPVTFKNNRIYTEEAYKYVAALVYKDLSIFSADLYQAGSYFYRGNKTCTLYNSENPSRYSGSINNNTSQYAKGTAVLEISGKTYIYKYVAEATLPAIQLRTVEKELTFTPINESYPQLSGTFEATADLGFTKQIPIMGGNVNYANINAHKRAVFNVAE